MVEKYITEEVWVKILNFLKTKKNIYIGHVNKCKNFIEAICWIMKTGAQWRYLPLYYGNWNSVFKRFNKWSKKNVWIDLMEFCIEDPDLEYLMIDSTIVRAHACAAGYKVGQQDEQGLGRSKGGFTSKIHAAVDALGNPLRFIITSGQKSDIKQADALIEDFDAKYVLADKGYDSDKFRDKIRQNNCTPVIPGRSNRKIAIEIDEDLYKERNKIECFFSKIKHFRRIAFRFDKSLHNFLSFLSFAGALIWSR